jgi:phasin family protein
MGKAWRLSILIYYQMYKGAHMEAVKKSVIKPSESVTETSREQTDTFLRSNNVILQGITKLSKSYIQIVQDLSEKNSNTAKELMACKNLSDFTDAQNKWVKENFDNLIESTSELSNISYKVTIDILKPINDQMTRNINLIKEILESQ